jgi:hypothetical protein
MPEQIRMLQAQLADLIAKDVRRHAHCTGFGSVWLHRLAEGQIPGTNWSLGGSNYDAADERACNDALREIIPRMQRQYRLC